MPIAIPGWLAVAMLAFAVAPVFAHPLGNTSVNLYERVELRPDVIAVRFVLDISEFPALRETEFADTNDDGTVDAIEAATYLDGFWGYLEPRLVLTANGVPLPWRRVGQSLTFPPGQNGLDLMRAVYDLDTPQPSVPEGGSVQAVLTETAFEGVPGWHEMVVRAGRGVSLVESSAPETDVTNELTVYPPEMLNSPLSVREATFTYVTAQPSGSVGPSGPPATADPVPTDPVTGPRPVDPLVSLLGERLTLAAMAIGLFVAMFLGAAHALTPGHGKTLVAAYLVGTKAKLSQGLWLGATVALTHTAGILILGIATLAFTEWVVPERVVGWLSVATGLLITGLGAIFVWRSRRLRAQLVAAPASEASKTAGHVSGHHHDGSSGGHQHSSTPDLRGRDVAVLGIVGGLVPSGSALILLLSAIALNEILYGLLLIVSFGLGMAVVLASISTGIVLLRRTSVMGWERWRDPRLRPLATWLPVISGVLVMGLGTLLTIQAVGGLV